MLRPARFHPYTWFVIVALLAGCGAAPEAPLATATLAPIDRGEYPSPPDTLPGLIAALASEQPLERAGAAYALAGFGEGAFPALPALALNLSYDGPYVVRLEAAAALGALGAAAFPALPQLISVLHTDLAPVRAQAAESLGQIGNPGALPALARALDDPDPDVAVQAAQAIARLAGVKFSAGAGDGAGALEGGGPAIVVEARNWWRNSGQFQDWLGRAQGAAATATYVAASPTPIPSATPSASPTPAPTATASMTPTPEFTPTPTLTSGAKVVIAMIDKAAEYADIQNLGDAPQDLSGWRLVSVKGNQVCLLAGMIGPGETLRVWTNNPNGGGFNCGYPQNIWNNSEPDPGVLYNAEGVEVSRSGGG